MTTQAMLRISDEKAEILEPNGWRELNSLEWIELPGGNFLQINADGYFTGLLQGGAGGLLVCLIVLGLMAWLTP